MKAWIVVRIIGEGQVSSTSITASRFNGDYSYYSSESKVELFFRRQDALWVANQERKLFKQMNWLRVAASVRLIGIEVPFVATESSGVRVCKANDREMKRTGYCLTKNKAHELFKKFEEERRTVLQ